MTARRVGAGVARFRAGKAYGSGVCVFVVLSVEESYLEAFLLDDAWGLAPKATVLVEGDYLLRDAEELP